MGFVNSTRLASLVKRAYAQFNHHIGLEDEDIEDIGYHVEDDSCEAFGALEELLEEERIHLKSKVQLLSLRPPGELSLPVPHATWQEMLHALLQNSVAAGANSVCFSTYINEGHLWISITDNGWGFPLSRRSEVLRGQKLGAGLSEAFALMAKLGGGLMIGQPKTGAEIILRLPIHDGTKSKRGHN